MDDPAPAPPGDAHETRATAFVLSGGANMAAVQVGMLRALVERGIRADMIVGCSIGAVNGAGLAQDPTLAGIERLEQVWSTTDARDLAPRPWLPRALALLRRREAIDADAELRRLVDRAVTVATFADLAVPLHCVATEAGNSAEAWFDGGPLADALLASSAMPSTFPPVTIGGLRYLDGSLVDDVPVRRAAELGARRIYVLEVGPPTHSWSDDSRPLRAAIDAYWTARRHRFQRELDAVARNVEVHLLPHGDLVHLGACTAAQTEKLMAGAHRAAAAHLASAHGTGDRPLAATAGGAPAAPRAWRVPPGRSGG